MTTRVHGVERHGHPGAQRQRPRSGSKGRMARPEVVAAIAELTKDLPCRRDLLIEFLHRIQDHYGHLTLAHLAALAQLLAITQSEVYEVASFYAHFTIIHPEDPVPVARTIRVCNSISCVLAGSQQLKEMLYKMVPEDRIRIVDAPCMGRCHQAPIAEIDHCHVGQALHQDWRQWLDQAHCAPVMPEYVSFADYNDQGGYQLLKQCLADKRRREDIIGVLQDAALRGLGGAGFPIGKKWEIVRSYPKPRLMAVNADEGEPGTFKDRHYLEHDPHRFIEGMLIAAWVIEAEKIYIYVRDEYPAIRQVLAAELAEIDAQGLWPRAQIEIRRGAGAYICGEESAMIESIEGKRGLPRHRPPYIAEVGLFGRPTLANNVETLYWVRDIVDKGSQWFTNMGVNNCSGFRSFSVSGRVSKPGVKWVPAGISAQALIDEYCGGMAEGHTFKAFLPGGASGGILPASLGHVPMDFGTLEAYGCFTGSGAVVVFSEQDNMADVCLNLMQFFAAESCGQCTPCRLGCAKSVQLLEQKKYVDRELLQELSTLMADASICGLGQAAGNPIACLMKYFPEDLA